MASEAETNEIHSVLDRLINSRNRDLSHFIPFLLGFTGSDPDTPGSNSGQNTDDPDHISSNQSDPDDQRDRIILINPLTQGMVVIEGTGFDTLFRGVSDKNGPPPASKSSIEMLPRVEIKPGEENECVVCLEEWKDDEVVKEMPCKHKFHGECIEKWLGLHGSCPVCRFMMPVEEDEPGKKGEERERREIWVSFSFGSRRRRGGVESGNSSEFERNSDDIEG